MSDTSSFLILKNFGGGIEVAPSAVELKERALGLSKPILKVETEEEQSVAILALRELKSIRTGIEATRKSVKAPVLELGKKIDTVATDFIHDAEKEEFRLQGLINHYQRRELEKQRAEQERIRQTQIAAQRLEYEAKRKREEAEKANDPALKEEAEKLEEQALDKTMSAELSPAVVAPRPRGLVVQQRLNFQILDAVVFAQAYPQFWTWHEETETLKLKRREILEELNRADGQGFFHATPFPEELPDKKDSRIVKPAGMRVFEETKSHIR